MAACYVDDVRFLTGTIGTGRRWDSKEKRLVCKQEWEREDEISGETDSRRTAREMINIMNSVYRNIQFEPEIPEDFSDSKLPTLDFRMWLDQGDEQEGRHRDKVMFSFFEKEMASPFCIMEKSAMPESTTVSSLSQDLIRRMVNTCERVLQQERDRIIEEYIKKLHRSGYNKEQIWNIVESGLKGYETKLDKAAKTGARLHRSAGSTMASRHKKKLLNKTTWFKKKSGGDKDEDKTGRGPGKSMKETGKTGVEIEVSTVLFVERTWHGELAKRMRQAEAEISGLTGDKLKVVEKSGTALKDLLHKTNPWAGQDCGRQDCLICTKGGEDSGDCKKRNLTYQTFCLPCKLQGKNSRYIGESSRTGHERGLEHWTDYQKEQEFGMKVQGISQKRLPWKFTKDVKIFTEPKIKNK